MPTKKPLKKAKRTNWKALYQAECESKAGILDGYFQKKDQLELMEKRAEAVEKHNAMLLADAEKLSHCSICGADRCEFPLEYVCDSVPCLDGYKAKLAPEDPELFHVEQKAKATDNAQYAQAAGRVDAIPIRRLADPREPLLTPKGVTPIEVDWNAVEATKHWPPPTLWQRLKAWVWG